MAGALVEQDRDPTKEFLEARRQAYVTVFAGERGKLVREDLARFCRADESTFHPDARMEGILQGRREVWIRISKHLNLSPDEMEDYFNPQGASTNG